jgi:hypothetical protein
MFHLFFFGLGFYFTDGPRFFGTSSVPAVVESIVDRDATDRNLMGPIVVSKICQRLFEQWKSDSSKILWFYRNKDESA